MFYRRAAPLDISDLDDILHYFSEVAPCGVIGSLILDNAESDADVFTFKHHYITGAIDSDVLASLFTAMREKRAVTISNLSRNRDMPRKNLIIPLRVFISVQSGRQHLLAYVPEYETFHTYRVDYLSNVQPEAIAPHFDELRAELDQMQSRMWGVSVKRNKFGVDHLEHVDFTVKVEDNEEYIIARLYREKRVGTVERLDENTYRFSADVYDSSEMLPWIRTFICRIVDINISERSVEDRFKRDIEAMYRMYNVREGESE